MDKMLSFSEANEHVIDIVSISVGVFITIVAVFGNILTLIAILKFKSLQVKSNILILSLSCSDVVCVLCWIILEAINVTLKLCKADPMLYIWLYMTNATFLQVSNLHLVMISIERYIAIFLGLHYHKLINNKRFRILVGFCWVLPFIVNSAITPWISDWNKENHSCSYGDIWTRLNMYIYVTFYFIYSSLVVYLYLRIYKAAKSQKQQINALQIGGQTTGRKVNLRAIKTLSLLLAAFFISWTPYFINIIVKFFTPAMNISLYMILYYLTFNIALMNSAVNFFIYAYNKKDFRNAYKMLLGCKVQPLES